MSFKLFLWGHIPKDPEKCKKLKNITRLEKINKKIQNLENKVKKIQKLENKVK